MKAKDVIVSRKTTNEDGTGIIAGGKKLIGKKVVPALGFTDAAMRAHEGDWVGAGIGTVAGGLGLIPTPMSQGASVGLDAFNQLRDYAKERGGWSNLGKDLYQSIKDQEYDPSFLPEEFDHLHQLEEQGILDEEGLRSYLVKKGIDAAEWLRNLRRKTPDAPPRAPDNSRDYARDYDRPAVDRKKAGEPPLTMKDVEYKDGKLERDAIARAEEKAARQAEKQPKITDRRGQLKDKDIPIINKDAPAAPTQSYPKYDPKVHGSKEDYLKNMTKDEFDRYKATQELLSKEGPAKPGWVRRAGGWVADNPKKTLAALGTGYYLTPDSVTDTVVDFVTGKAKGAVKDAILNIDTTGAGELPFPYETKPKPAPAPADNAPAPAPADNAPAPAPADNAPAPVTEPEDSVSPARSKFGNQSKAPQQDKEKELAEKYRSYTAQLSEQQQLDLDELRKNPNVRVMLDLISKAEGNTDYDTIVGGGKFKDFSSHPNQSVKLGKGLISDAAGKYQIMGFNWGPYSKKLGLKDFSPESQDKIAIQMLADRGALNAVLKGDFTGAVKKSGSQWTSLPATEIIQGRGPKPWKWVNDQVADLKKVHGIDDSTNGTRVAQADKEVTKQDTKAARPGYYAVGDSQAQGVAGYGGEQWNKSMAYRGASILDPKQFKIHLANIEKIPPGSVVAISGGGNDVSSAKPEKIVDQMNKLIAAAKARGLQVVHLLPTATDNPKTQQLRDQLRQAMKQGQTIAPIVDLGFASKKDPMNLHLDPKGYKTIAKNITDMLPIGSVVAGEVPTGLGGPLKTSKKDSMPMAPDAAELARINKKLHGPDPLKDLAQQIDQKQKDIDARTAAIAKELEKTKSDYDKDKARLADKPGTIRIGPLTITPPDTSKSVAKKSSPVPKEMPSVDDYGNVIEPGKITKKAEKPADKKVDTTTSARKSDAPDLAPKKSKSDSDLSKPAAGVSTRTEPPKSDKPANAAGDDKKAAAPEKKAAAPEVPANAAAGDDKKAASKVDVRKDFEQAFKAARDKKGAGDTFTWTNPVTGKKGTYTTDYAKEKKASTPAVKTNNTIKDKPADNVEVKPFEKPIDKDVLDKLTKQDKDSWDTARNAIKINPATGNVTDKEVPLPNVTVTSEPVTPNVWRDTSGKPITNKYGDPWRTGTSTQDDVDAAKIELQRQAEIEKDKNKLQAISPDLSKPPESSWKDIWNNSIENLTGKKRMSQDELNTIRVPESINNELADILRLAGRKK
jgi:muramidase (phage lysozyme)